MNKTIFAISGLVAVLALTGCSRPNTEPATGAPEKTAEPESRVKHGTNGQIVITLDAATQKVMGLETVSLVATQLSPQIKGFGRVLDAAPLADLIVELGKAELEFDASHAELERMKVLKAQNNASEKTFQTAEFTYRQNQASIAAVFAKIKNGWGDKFIEMTGPIVVPVGTERKWNPVLEQVLDNRATLVRVDLNAGEAPGTTLSKAQLVPLGEGAAPVAAELFDEARTVDPQTQAQGFLFLTTARLKPGQAVTAFMELDMEAAPAAGVILPRAAVVRFNGATWLYRQNGDEEFERVAVALNQPLESGWFVAQGLNADAKVVTVGAQQLLSEELKGQGGGEE